MPMIDFLSIKLSSFLSFQRVITSSPHTPARPSQRPRTAARGSIRCSLYSGWYCAPTNQGWFSISTTSTRFRVGIHAHGLHAGRLELLQIVVVELVTVAVTLRNVEFAVGGSDFRAFLQRTGIGAQTHRAAFGRNALLLLHQVDHRMRRLLHLARIGIGEIQHVARELDHGTLHAQADAQERDVVLAGEAHGLDLPSMPRLPKPGATRMPDILPSCAPALSRVIFSELT